MIRKSNKKSNQYNVLLEKYQGSRHSKTDKDRPQLLTLLLKVKYSKYV